MILVDSNVWIDFFHGKEKARHLSTLLENKEVLSHPWIFGEFMMGNLGSKRRQILSEFHILPKLQTYPIKELFEFIERHSLYGKGLSLIDTQLLYATLCEDCLLWTFDGALQGAAKKFGRIYLSPNTSAIM